MGIRKRGMAQRRVSRRRKLEKMAIERAFCLNAPMNPNTLSTFAKCRYHSKFRARWYGSSGNCMNSNEDKTLEIRVEAATTSVVFLEFESPILYFESCV